MFFYCTTKIKDYYKVGVASSLDRIKKRLTTYRSSNPGIKIKFFSEIDGLDQDLEWSYKNKFADYRVSKSECYRLDIDVIYKHFLKFLHKFKKLHHFWSARHFYLSEYYIDKELDDYETFDFSESTLKDARFGFFPSFIPIAYLDKLKDKIDKDGNVTVEAKILDINKVDLKSYRYKYNKHLKEKFYGQQYWYLSQEFKKFFDDNFKIKKKFKAKSVSHVEHPVNIEIFNMFEKKHKTIIKKYPINPAVSTYWERPEQKHLFLRSIYLSKKIKDKFKGKDDIEYILSGISKIIPRSNNELYLGTLLRVMSRFSIRAPAEIRELIHKMEREIEKKLNKIKAIDSPTEIPINNSKKRTKKRHLKLVK